MTETAVHPLIPGDPQHVGPYALLGRLGAGGQGVVYLALTADGSKVALKVLRTALDEQARRRFQREFEVLRQVAGFCTARLLDADVTGMPPYFVSEYVAGPSLFALVQRSGVRRGADLDRLAIAMATALTAIHRAGIVHRDLKPHNVLMGPDGPRVIDFGIARAVGSVDQTSGSLGTPAFLAPEQLSDERAGTPADIFAWGATMVYAASGTYPFGNDSVQSVVYRVLHKEPDLGSLSGPLRELVAACLAKDPSRRPTAQDLMYRIMDQRVGEVPASAAAPATVADLPEVTGPDRSRRMPGIRVVAAIGAVVVLLAALGVYAWQAGGSGGGTAGAASAAGDIERPPAYAQAARKRAEAAFETVNSYDYRTINADYKRMEDETAGRAGQELGANFIKNASTVKDDKMVQTGLASGSGIVAASPDRVTVLVYGETLLTAAERKPKRGESPMVMEMIVVGGVWKLEYLWPLAPQPDSSEKKSGEWPRGAVQALLSTAGGQGSRAVAFDESSAADRATALVLRPDGTLSRVAVVRAGDAFKIESTKRLLPAT